MKTVVLVGALGALIFGNVGLMAHGEAYLVFSRESADKWGKTCKYYYPFRLFSFDVTVGQPCPTWVSQP